MLKIILLSVIAIIFSGCANKHGLSSTPYDDCKEYYDFQGYYHKDCGEKDIVSYKAIGEAASKAYDSAVDTVTFKEKEKPKQKPNVW